MTRLVRPGRWLGLLLGAVVVLGAAAPAVAHDATTTAHAEVSGTGRDVDVVLELEYDLLMKSAWLYAEAYEATQPAEQQRQLERHADAVTAYALERFQVAYGGDRCAGAPVDVPGLTTRGDRAFAVLALEYRCAPAEDGTHELFSALFPDDENFVHSTRTVVHHELDGIEGAVVLAAGDPAHAVSTASGSAGRDLGGFVVLGAEHLVLGPDHLLFLLALLIGSRGRREVVLTATAFTAAHSVTFLLAALGVVSVPSVVVEPLIALSIVVVSVLHLAGRGDGASAGWRLPVVFGFGLLHGLGFAGALGVDEPWSWTLLWSMLAFNGGLEVAQLVLIALVLPAITLLRRTRRGHHVMLAAAVGVAAVGTFWFVERLSSAAWPAA